MKVATLLFTYHRSYHTGQVMHFLEQNTILPQKLIIFQDGLKSDEDIYEWKRVNELINTVDWCDKEIVVSDYNKGLAASIVYGIDYAFNDYDAVIVLEDDCVPAANFIAFMQQCFEKYQSNKRIYSISGYSWPIKLKRTEYDVYGCGRISSWGWGTWKDRWEEYDIDNDIIARLKQDKLKSQNLAMWGKDCEKMLLDRIAGDNDSWAIYWALKVIENEGVCINPYESLIQNIGMDGTGVHCRREDKFRTAFSKDLKHEFKLPDDIVILDDTKKTFVQLYGNYTSVNWNKEIKEKALVYGIGKFYLQYEKEINDKYYIEAFVDRKKKGWFAGKEIVHINQIDQLEYDKIIIMVQNIQECINISRELVFRNISADKILLGHNFYGKYGREMDNICILPDGYLSATVSSITLKIRTMDEFNNAHEVLVGQIYQYYINNGKKDVILDVGMNIGDAALYFLKSEKVKKVYAYEPFKETYLAAVDNLKTYLQYPGRIEIFQYGLSNENDTRMIGFNSNMTCGQSTIAGVRKKAYHIYHSMGLAQPENEQLEQIVVRDAAEEFMPIIQKHWDCNIILKMDCEGEEYGIIETLLKKGILSSISFIMLEWHYRGKDSIISCLQSAGFSYWCNDKNKDMGLVYAINLKEREKQNE